MRQLPRTRRAGDTCITGPIVSQSAWVSRTWVIAQGVRRELGQEQRSIFLRLLIPKLPAPDDPDLTRGILEAIDMESYRVEARQAMTIALEDEEGMVKPPPAGQGGFQPEPELEPLSVILNAFNELFADAGFTEDDRVKAMRQIEGPIMGALAESSVLSNSLRNSSEDNTRATFQKLFQEAMVRNVDLITQVYAKQNADELFRQHLERMVFDLYKARMQDDATLPG